MWGHMGWGWGGGTGWGWSILGGVHMILWWVLLILGIVVLSRWLVRGFSRDSGDIGNRALDILKERYARGEIGKDEFEQKKHDLQA